MRRTGEHRFRRGEKIQLRSSWEGATLYYVFNGALRPDLAVDYPDVLPLTMTALGRENPIVSTFNFGVTATPNGANDTLVSRTFNDIDSVNSGWNLVGNPTPSTIDWNVSGWTKTNMDGTIDVWNPSDTIGGYKTWNGSTGSLGSGRIAPFQAFWVKANAASPLLTCANGVKSTGGAFLGKDRRCQQVGIICVRFRRKDKHEHRQVSFFHGRCPSKERHDRRRVGTRSGTGPLSKWTSGANICDVHPQRKADVQSIRCVQPGSALG